MAEHRDEIRAQLFERFEIPGHPVEPLGEFVDLLVVAGGDGTAEVAAGHALADRERIKRKDLRGEDVLALGQGHQLHDVVVALCEEFGAHLRFDYEGTSLDTLREMVAMGMGITFLPGLYIEGVARNDESIRVLSLADRQIYRTVGMAWRISSERQEEYRKLADLLRGLIAERFPQFAVVS